MDKKPFKETRFGQWLDKAKDKIPEIASVGMEILTGDVGGAIEKIQDILDRKEKYNSEAAKLKQEWEMYKLDFQKELLQMDAADRANARSREVEMARATGKRDWMQSAVGITLLCFGATVLGYGLFFDIKNPEPYARLEGYALGLVSTVAIYYFGSTQGSKNKQQTIDKMLEK